MTMFFAPFLYLKIKWAPVYKKTSRIGIVAGNSLMLSQKLPSINKTKDRWNPHPKHSTPK
jgi:hypothetical protein